MDLSKKDLFNEHNCKAKILYGIPIHVDEIMEDIKEDEDIYSILSDFAEKWKSEEGIVSDISCTETVEGKMSSVLYMGILLCENNTSYCSDGKLCDLPTGKDMEKFTQFVNKLPEKVRKVPKLILYVNSM